eukprot:1196338-Prorocentrum_minimum.AAC.2
MFPPAPERTLSSGRPGCTRGFFMRAGRPGPASNSYYLFIRFRLWGVGCILAWGPPHGRHISTSPRLRRSRRASFTPRRAPRPHTIVTVYHTFTNKGTAELRATHITTKVYYLRGLLVTVTVVTIYFYYAPFAALIRRARRTNGREFVSAFNRGGPLSAAVVRARKQQDACAACWHIL